MDIVLLLLGFTFMIIGLLGSFLPLLPGPSLSWLGLLLLFFTKAVAFNYWIIGITLVITIVITILDYVIPAKGTKHFGGSTYGVWGTNIGLIIGLFFPPFGFLIGPFLGAFMGELCYNAKEHKRALQAAIGSFIGFLASTFMKFLVCLLYFGLFLLLVWRNKANFQF